MTQASSKADGAPPSGVDQSVFRPAGQMIGGFSAAGAAVLALSLIAHAHGSAGLSPADMAAPVKDAAKAVQPLLPPEGLAGPSAAALAPDSRAVIQALLRKAGLRQSLDPRRLSWDQARKVNAVLPVDPSASGFAQPFHLAVNTRNGRQALQCLTQAAYFEAGASGPLAQAAVVQVVLNRVRHPDFPKSVCGVVYEGADRADGCQFTFTCDGTLQRPVDPVAFEEAKKVAGRALSGYVDRAVGAATYYHADYVFPTWAPTLVKLATVGPHIFYRVAGVEGQAAALTGQYAGGELKLTKAILSAGDKRTQKAAPVQAAGRAQVQQASMPAGLRTVANRLQRVRIEIAAAAAAPKADETPKVRTASLQASVQATLDAGALPPIPPPPALAPAAADSPIPTAGAGPAA
jgi:spore germination cell wall hydrolase CwlJ-like protein